MTARRKPLIGDRRVAAALGAALMAGAAICFYDAYERRGRKRPLPVRWLGV
jgi:hypothetical protein